MNDNRHHDDRAVSSSRECPLDMAVGNGSSSSGIGSGGDGSFEGPMSSPPPSSPSAEGLLPAVAATAVLSTLLGMAIARYLLARSSSHSSSSSSFSSSSRRRRARRARTRATITRAGSSPTSTNRARSRARCKGRPRGRSGKRRGGTGHCRENSPSSSPPPPLQAIQAKAHPTRRRSRSSDGHDPSNINTNGDGDIGSGPIREERHRDDDEKMLRPWDHVLEGAHRSPLRRRIRQPQQPQPQSQRQPWRQQLEFEHDLSELTDGNDDDEAAMVIMATTVVDGKDSSRRKEEEPQQTQQTTNIRMEKKENEEHDDCLGNLDAIGTDGNRAPHSPDTHPSKPSSFEKVAFLPKSGRKDIGGICHDVHSHSHSPFDAATLPSPPLTPSTLHTTVTPSCLSSMMTSSSPSQHPPPPTLPPLPPPSLSLLQPRRPSKISFVAMDPSCGNGAGSDNHNDIARNGGNHFECNNDSLLGGGGATMTTTAMRPFRSSFRRSSALRDSMLDSIRDSVKDSLTDDEDEDDDDDEESDDSHDSHDSNKNESEEPTDDNDDMVSDEPPPPQQHDTHTQTDDSRDHGADANLNAILPPDWKPTSQSAPALRRPISRHSQNHHHLVKRNSWSSGLHSLSHQHHRSHPPNHPHPDVLFDGEDEFESLVLSPLRTMHEARRLLRRTRAISALANRLMAAKDEATCIDEVTRLMAIMFTVDRVSFAFLTGEEHFTLKRITIKPKRDPVEEGEQEQHRWQSSFDLEYLESDLRRPLAGTAAGVCAKTLREHYTPRTAESPFHTHRVFYEQGLHTVLATPILVNGNKCTGVILLSKREEDAFQTSDRILIRDIANLLGANIYAKRLRKQTEESNRLSREMLHSFVPPKVLEKIEGYWDEKSEKYGQNPNKTGSSTSCSSSTENSVSGTDGGALDASEHLSLSSLSPRGGGKVQPHPHAPHRGGGANHDDDASAAIPRSNSWYVANTDWTEAALDTDSQRQGQHRGRKREIESRIRLMRNMEGRSADNVGVIVSTEGMELAPTSRALYAENVRNVCIIFTDIVGFSKISLELSPIKVMNMLQDLFNRFDNLCDVHGVMKLETIGDAYLCATNLLEDDDGDEDVVRDAAVRALGMAKDMICEARNVIIPYHDKSGRSFDDCTLQIRVGIHVGDITCGVLGQRVPKFTTCGTAVNMAARMEQTSKPSMIRATQDFHDLVGDAETNWSEKQSISLKNMGTVETYLLDPIYPSKNDVFGECGRSRSVSDSFLSLQYD